MRIVEASRKSDSEAMDISEHVHDCEHQLDYFVRGQGKYLLGDIWLELKAGDFFYVPPRTSHQFVYESGTRRDTFSIKSVPENDGSPLISLPPFNLNIVPEDRKKIHLELKKIVSHVVMEKPVPKKCEKRLMGFLARFYELYRSAETGTAKKIQQIRNILKNNYGKQINLSWLSKKVNLNQQYLCRAYKKMTGENIIDRLLIIRMEKSRKLLVETDLPIKEIAFMCGFKNTQYFHLCFKKYYDMSPGFVRKNDENNSSLSVNNFTDLNG